MSEFPRKSEDKVNTFTIAMIGGVAAILLWASVVALQAYYAKTGGTLETARATDGQDNGLRAARAEQLGALADYVWVDRTKATAKIPIERAMQLVVIDHRAGKASLVPAVGAHDTATVTPSGGAPGVESAESGDAAGVESTESSTAAGVESTESSTAAGAEPTPTLALPQGGGNEAAEPSPLREDQGGGAPEPAPAQTEASDH